MPIDLDMIAPNSARPDSSQPQKFTIKDQSEFASNEELTLRGNLVTETKDSQPQQPNP